VVCLPFVWRLFKPVNVQLGALSWQNVLRQSLPYGAFIVLGAVYAQMDIVIVSVLLPLAAVATFQVALRILVATDYVPEAAWRWAYPRLTRSSGRGVSDFGSQTTRLALGLLVIGLGVAAVLIVISPWMIPFVFGSTYVTAVVPMQLMAAAIPLRYGAHVYGTALSAAGFQARRSRLFLTVVIAAIVLECVLIALGGLTGATVAIFLSSSLLAITYFVSARRIWGVHLDARPLAGTCLIATLTFLAILAIQR